MSTSGLEEGLAWQTGVWDRISDLYWNEIDPRFEPVVDGVIARADLREGERVLDVGTGTGAVASKAAALVGPSGKVVAVDPSPEMLELARRRAARPGVSDFQVESGTAEAIPAEAGAFDVLLASLSLMYSVDRGAAACELARVLRSGGRFVAAVWAGAAECDIVAFQQTAGSFAPPPPVAGVGPGALADPQPFLDLLAEEGLDVHVEKDVLGFEFPNFESAWEVLAGVTTAQLPDARREEAKDAVRSAMWPDPQQSRRFRNATQFLVGVRK
jgi:SAM-dependent methyltransferase